MTISIKVHVNGDYRATVKHTIEGDPQPDTVIDGTGEGQIYFRHGKVNTFEITEQQLTAEMKAAKVAPPTT